MKRRKFAVSLFWAIGVGGIVALLTSEQRAVSLRIWLAAFAVWFAVSTLRRLFEDAPMFPSKMHGLFTRRSNDVASTGSQLRDIRAIEGLLVRAGENERAFTQQLRPRLVQLADHYLLLHHGIDRRTQHERAALVLGEVAWLVEPGPTHRTPTPTELDRFVDLLGSPAGLGTEEAV